MTRRLELALAKGAQAERLTPEEALELASPADPDHLHRLGAAALANRLRRHERRATYVVNLQINPSNLCGNGCAFCSYSARPDSPHAYSLAEAEILEQVTQLRPSEVHIVGGLNELWGYARNLALVRTLRQQFPALHIKGYTAVEIDFFARQTGRPIPELLRELQAAGLNALPGGGAEIFSAVLRARFFPRKLAADAWLDVHRQAHRLGLPSNATMLFGLGEAPADRVAHLLRLRALQEETGGFRCFIPLPCQPGWEGAPANLPPPPAEILAVTALARLVLDNIPHLKAYWPMTGLETAAAALSWGADDLDGTLGRERIAHAAGATTPAATSAALMRETIRQGGFDPVERGGSCSPAACPPPPAAVRPSFRSAVHPPPGAAACPIALLPYANSAPFAELGPPAGCRFVPLVPSAALAALRAGEVAAALAPIGGLPSLAALAEPLGQLGIAADGPSHSVLFFSQRPFDQFDAHCRVRLTSQSATSTRLLFLLLSENAAPDHWPRLAGPDEAADGELVIGDDALQRLAQPRPPGEIVTDLPEEWRRRHGRPFVFARWLVRRDLATAPRAALAAWQAEFAAREDELLARCVPATSRRLGLSEPRVLDYLRNLRRQLGPREDAAQELFLRRLAQLPELPRP